MNSIDGKKIIELKKIIIDSFDKSKWIELGLYMNSSELIEGHPRLLRSLDWGDDDYEGNVLQVLNRLIADRPERYEAIQAFIREKLGILPDEKQENISTYQGKKADKTIIFSPSPEVFIIPDKPQDNNLIAVMMPFKELFSPVYNMIKKTCKEKDIDCKRADDLWINETIIQDIFELIFACKVLVADFSEKNPNVFYEVGIAHALGKTVIPIAQSMDDVPADLRHHRVLLYNANEEGLGKFSLDLENRINILFPEKDKKNWW